MTPPKRWQLVKSLFRAALEQPATEREAFLRTECDDPGLRAEVARLLELHERPSEFLTTPLDGAVDPLIGRELGEFRIVRALGTGGMGSVYEAEQQHPRRRAAVKVLRPGFISARSMRRFGYESELLARLQHPGIATVYASGTFDQGGGAQPWFAMELIEGRPLLEHVRDRRLGTAATLELLILICEAVHHAHLRGIVHRDLKPANVLVDATGRPKVLDFGVARSVDSDATAALTMQTSAGELIGTLSYMSPEQLSRSPGEVDVRSDVYALGVIGYELLAGRLPLQPRSTAVTELIRAISEDQPPALGAVVPSLRGDIETIFTKALEKDAERRYASALDLGMDLRRYLAHEPIEARPATRWYQFRKFARRNRALVGGTATTIVALAVGLALYATQARHARREADRSRYEADKATAINNFITNDFLMKLLTGIRARGQSVSEVAGLLDFATTNVDTMFAGQPAAEAAVRNEIATIYYNLGAYDRAAEQFRIALDRWEARLGPDHPDTLKAVNNLGQTLMRQNRPELAEPLYHRALQGRRRALGNDDPFTLVSINNLAELYRAAGRFDEAEAMLREVLAAQRRVHGEANKNTITTMSNLGALLATRGRVDEALVLHRDAHDISARTLGEEHVTTLAAAQRLGQTLHRAGRTDEAAALLSRAADTFERTLGPSAGETITSRRALARVYRAQGDLPAARAQLERARSGAAAEPVRHAALIRAIDEEIAKLAEPIAPTSAATGTSPATAP